MSSVKSLSFHHPLAFWLGCLAISFGVLSHIPMFIHASHMGYKMVGMPMDTAMLVGMFVIPVGLLLSAYGLMPRLSQLKASDDSHLYFHIADNVSLNKQHWTLVLALFVAVAVDVMKPATLGFVMPGMMDEYQINSQTVGILALVALTGTAIGSVFWGMLSDIFGRRAAILLSALMFIGTAICGAMPSFEWNLAMCFLMGMSAGGLLPITFALMAECVPSKHRGWLLVALGGLGTAAGYLMAAGSAAWLEPLFSWRILWLLGLPTGLLVIFLNRYIPESPRFLANKGLITQAKQTIRLFCQGREQVSDNVVVEKEPVQNASFRQLLSGPYKQISIGLMMAGIAWGLVNFGFLLWLPTNLHILGLATQANSLLTQSAFLAVPGVLIVTWLYHSWSSIKALTLFIGLTALSLFGFGVLAWLSLLSASMVIFITATLLICSSGVIAMLIPYAAEIYPVHLRGTGAGVVAASSKIGGIVGSALGVIGLLDYLAFSAFLIVLPLLFSFFLLVKNGIETKGLSLEEVEEKILELNSSNI
ncbi:MFS transporter [Catenovulum sp. 2E275]|uniref:MFS transporter n=1 Tax=Catenovulum sp. 2E275 TaxID=2980497 RepID=UPI0021D11606|nr:MFS transporter [Catenovulum sp. 2E275]MCU4674044.1 MFS transporter [Catenovulum sp. 2E275]